LIYYFIDEKTSRISSSLSGIQYPKHHVEYHPETIPITSNLDQRCESTAQSPRKQQEIHKNSKYKSTSSSFIPSYKIPFSTPPSSTNMAQENFNESQEGVTGPLHSNPEMQLFVEHFANSLDHWSLSLKSTLLVNITFKCFPLLLLVFFRAILFIT